MTYELPSWMPEWATHDDLGGKVPSEVRQAISQAYQAGRESMREECRQAIKKAEELDGEMPDEIFAFITGSRGQATQTQRAVVRATKVEILDYINGISL